ncbi:tunicamycin resistance protein [Apiotrichum porosum]|uniref:UDP-N-acetylglucosamine--dolichyl-phosphate N-acetylglucosaminephosphotransferase n=1 Tax=Apiotrichum porosum TaxID=105984 RepID=A0A427XM72_9TREE|nr:tunicamycin resistance protein [Apiotrichum porosum]RSH79991.1 tunicamycin resistance protein [Apiotrichum porosum]
MLAFVGAVLSVPMVGSAFIAKGLKGRDLLKPNGRTSGPWIPECLGLPLAAIYLGLMMMFIPFPFSHMFHTSSSLSIGRETFPQGELTLYMTSLLSLLTATLLGFIDDLFDIRWRHKLPIPLIAAIPTLMVYYSEGGWTWVVLPASLGKLLSTLGLPGWEGTKSVDLGFLYYVYLALLPTFTTNSINILAGVNGVETIQALIIALSVAFNDLLFLPIWPDWLLEALHIGNAEEGRILSWAAGEVVKRHLMSLYFMLPLIGVCAGFLTHNWYPAKAFPGDTLCYFTGMAFSAVAIQGHFPKTMILFFLPQIFNFVLSCPQLFGLVECPRHRLPHFDASTGLLQPSLTVFKEPPPFKTKIALEVMEVFGLTRLERGSPDSGAQTKTETNGRKTDGSSTAPPVRIVSATNLTILNLILVHLGPLHEQSLCFVMATVQLLSSMLAFTIRYGVGSLVYGGDRR